MSNQFLKKYLSVILFHVFVLLKLLGIHILEVVARKKSVLMTGFFKLIKCIRCPCNFLKREKSCSEPWSCENKPANVEISKKNQRSNRILSAFIFIFRVKSIKLKSIIDNWNVYEWIFNFQVILTRVFEKKMTKYYLGLKWMK